MLARHEVIHPDGRQFLLYGDVDDATLAALAAQPADSGYDPSLLHRRYDRLTDAWVLVSPARNVRPSTTTTGEGAPPCPLCPGGPELPGPFGLAVFENRYPSMSLHAPEPLPRLATSSVRRAGAASSSSTPLTTSSTSPTSRCSSSPTSSPSGASGRRRCGRRATTT